MFEQFGIINPWIYIAGAFMIVIAPGPNSLYVLKTSVLDGRRAGCAGLLAVLIGDAVLIFLAYLGVAAMIKSHPLAFSMVKPENRGIYTQSDSPKKSSRNIWSLAVVSVDQRY